MFETTDTDRALLIGWIFISLAVALLLTWWLA